MNNIAQTVIGQYRTSPTIMGIVERFDSAIEPSADIEALRSTYIDIDTAAGVGLDRIGRMVGLDRRVKSTKAPAIIDIAIIDASIIDDTSTGDAAITMSDGEYRAALRLKAYTNITRCTVETMNFQLRTMAAGRGNAWVHDMNGMSISYYFAFQLTAVERALIRTTDMLLRPSCCEDYIVEAPYTPAIIDFAVIDLTVIGT